MTSKLVTVVVQYILYIYVNFLHNKMCEREVKFMLNLGCHLTSAKGFKNMGKEALKINANTFQFFTRNPRGGKAKDIDEEDE